ncbi:MAG: hypothetical protein HQ538_02575 [Parcubacteria group bacterium]|nr:hypothetical protein [Parcubacteria group bacterium]
MKRITIRESKTADSRTCDPSKVTKKALLESSKQHIDDVKKGMNFIATKIDKAAEKHDHTKLSGIDQFHSDFIGSFKNTKWWDEHRAVERHHLSSEDGIPEDVDLVDVIEFLVDGVMAGLARSGKYRKENFPTELLMRAFDNTVDKLVKVVDVRKKESYKAPRRILKNRKFKA